MRTPLRHVIQMSLFASSASGVNAQNVYLASVSSGGEQANAACSGRMAASGTAVVMTSQATNLIEDDTNGSFWDVFVHDLKTGVTTVESVSSSDEQGNSHSEIARISATGRFVIFESTATNLVPDLNGVKHIFARDRLLNTTDLISVSTAGEPANAFSGAGITSPDGRFTTFYSTGNNLVEFAYSPPEMFLRDRLKGETSLISLTSNGTMSAFQFNVGPGAISDDGRYVAFSSDATDMVPGLSSLRIRNFVRDLELGQTIHVSVPYNGSNPDARSYLPDMSADGRLVAFASDASNLVPGDTNGFCDVFVRDMLLSQTARISFGYDGSETNGSCQPNAQISRNGRFICFNSMATNIVRNDTNQMIDGFVHDRWTGTTELVTLNWQGEQLNANSGITGITDDGRVISFSTSANNVIAEPVNGFGATYVRERWKLGDVNRDGVVNVIDLLAIINAWGPCPAAPPPPALPIPCDADVTNDNTVNVADLLLIINNWG